MKKKGEVLLILLFFIFFFIFKACENVLDAFGYYDEEKQHLKELEVKKQKQREENLKKFYYPTCDNKYWNYEPKLVGCQGFLQGRYYKCDKKLKGSKVLVLSDILKHHARSYRGSLKIKIIETKHKKNLNKEMWIDFRCFKPDYSYGKWLNEK